MIKISCDRPFVYYLRQKIYELKLNVGQNEEYLTQDDKGASSTREPTPHRY